MAPISIDATDDVVTLVNVFTVTPETQQRLVELLGRATEEVMRHRPGFVSANIHAGLDGTRVANYAQWRSVEDFRAALEDPVVREHIDEITTFATADPQLYRVVSTHHS
ncbi:antibiotic biosynthesis monooxygenase [Rhodococcus sp. NCIMB 12038]|uniref:antibiotic biosynthesis monooxygenase family protein n=1 Tax=Rhodococcus sp. NCIMB 12038 TaxID=933800 RepID=UPI000B3BEA67|nr:antibiotic biosynthesis monooxygenase [Rhodococcus sp. NCIMB 12038]OUS95139.1 antibiotic biosynthesis monooxygenase [Rhodococcus sp. NCIMB 12038]